MQRDTVRIEKLPPDGIDQAADLLARSFETTPDYTHMFPDPHTRRDALRGFMKAPVRDSQAEGNCWVATDGTMMLGVAAWQAPGRYPWSLGRNLRALPAIMSVLRHAPGSFRDLLKFGSIIDSHFPDIPLWYLQVIGVSPEAQGLGVGSALLEPAFDLADRDRVPCYLETSNEKAVPFYLRAGFHIDRQGVELMPGGPTYWLMTRPPR
ncbi:MAG TPA: GNAT family N-acetyltransferase [Acidimicrobiia bacterium]|nr:GNAT family N-acetyltransferase [Acidimicrobiia bacterium]